jgi:pimeloyl-ACP methyl ester carboxylesterase
MKKVISRDGTVIAYDVRGQGPALVLVGGAFSYRGYPQTVKLAELLAQRHTVVTYDRRGRGDSTDTAPYAVGREIEDLEALIEAVGGSARVWGQSSGAVLALHAAAAGSAIERLAVYQPPFSVDAGSHVPPPAFAERLDDLLAAGRRGAAVRWFMTKGMGMPAPLAYAFGLLPLWSRLTALAHTLPYDLSVMGDTVYGRPLSRQYWGAVTQPTLVIHGARSPRSLRVAAKALADVLPEARHRELAGQSHNVSPEIMSVLLNEFFGTAARVPA